MKIENTFVVDLPIADAWLVLLDIPAIVPCMPGAELLSVEATHSYRGQVKVNLGPVSVAFQGRAKFLEIDQANWTVRVKASGVEMKGRGNADADVSFRLTPTDNGTRVDVTTDVNLAGAVAQYGRAQGVIASVAQVLIDQFATNLRGKLQAERGDSPAVDSSPTRFTDPKGVSIFVLIIAFFKGLFGGRSKGQS